jgi:hypothetical protein
MMSSVQNPTYMLAPNWTFRPNGPIALGNIVVDPFKPHRVLTKPDSSKPSPLTETTTDENWRLHLGKDRTVNLSLWVRFLQNIGFNVGTDHDKSTSADYIMESLETTYYTEEPSIEEVNERVMDPKVRKLMRVDNLLSKPVYMITGLKIAKGFKLTSERSSRHAAHAEASAPLASQATVGVQAGGSMENSRSDGFQSINDIVFAYQLLKIIPKGFKEKVFEIKEFQSKATFLGDEDTAEDAAVEVESSFAIASDLVEVGKGKVVTESKLNDGEVECVCISFKDK